jgi:hypothetical protein
MERTAFDKLNIGVRFIKNIDNEFNALINTTMGYKDWIDLMDDFFHYIDIGQNDKVYFYGNAENDVCLRFVEDWDDTIHLLELTDVYYYPKYYYKSDEQKNEEAIHNLAIVYALIEHTSTISETNELKKIDDDAFANIKIIAYKELKEKNRLI